ncbi:MAG: HAMP domain-containing sensor histidine kinase [Pseudohongiella sp.]|nr:HAMP domain-containing sensor histidine kinase [Pseudohongiella sp.]
MWELTSVAEAERLSVGLRYRVLRNREPLIAVSTLYSGSDDVTQAELEIARSQILDITDLEVDHSIAFIELASPDQVTGLPRYTAAQAAGELAILPAVPGREIDPRLIPAIEAASTEPGELILGAFIRVDSISYLPIVISTFNAGRPGTLLYLLNFSQLLDTVTKGEISPRTTFSLFHPLTGTTNHASLPALASEPEAHHVVNIDMGLYEWQLTWSFDANGSGSAEQRLAYTIALGGTLITLMLSFIIYNLLHQRQIIGEQIEKKTLELIETQTLLIQREKMAALGQMVASISHELNTPIGNSLLAATLLRSRSKDLVATLGDHNGLLTDYDRKDAIDTFVSVAAESTRLIEKNIQRATELIRSFKQVAVDQSSERRRRFNLSETLRELEHTLAPSLRAERLQFTLDVPGSINMDSYPGALYQVISNLVSNSMTHAYDHSHDDRTPYRGELLLEVTSIDKEHILIVFSDDGVGVADSVRANIFDPFFTTRLGSGGSGLGLHIVFTLVTDVLGGSIKLMSVEHGTTFQMTIPTSAPESKRS